MTEPAKKVEQNEKESNAQYDRRRYRNRVEDV